MRQELKGLFQNPDLPTEPNDRLGYIFDQVLPLQYADVVLQAKTGNREPHVNSFIEALAEDPEASKADIRLLARFMDQYPHILVETSIRLGEREIPLSLNQMAILIEAKANICKSKGYNMEETGKVIKQMYDATTGKNVKDDFQLLNNLSQDKLQRELFSSLDWNGTIIPNLQTANRLREIVKAK